MPSMEVDEERAYDYELRRAEEHWNRELDGGDDEDAGYDPSDGEGWSDEW